MKTRHDTALINVMPRKVPAHQVKKIHIAIDLGFDFTKAAFKLYYGDDDDTEILPSSLQSVSWGYHYSSVLTQIAFKNDGEILWGEAVSSNLDAGEIQERQVRRRFKPALFDPMNYHDPRHSNVEIRPTG